MYYIHVREIFLSIVLNTNQLNEQRKKSALQSIILSYLNLTTPKYILI